MTEPKTAHRIVPILTLLVLASIGAFAQSDSAPPPPAPAAAAADKQVGEKSGEGSRAAHSDSSYVIGADDVMAGGQPPLQLEQEITKRLQNYISEPEVTVIVQDSKSQRINILGMVAKPGSYLLTGSATVLDAIAMAGGFKDFAKQKSIYVLRANSDGTQKRISFNYKEVIKGKNPDQNVRLLPRDTVVVP